MLIAASNATWANWLMNIRRVVQFGRVAAMERCVVTSKFGDRGGSAGPT
jgi:hypothetical protein